MAFSQSAPQTRIDLSPRELLAISQSISREFAPRFGRDEAIGTGSASSKSAAFSVRELLAISEEISREFAPRPIQSRSSLVLLPIDPRRLHAYWLLGTSSVKTELNTLADNPKSVAEEQLTLRVFRQDEPSLTSNEAAKPECWFDIAVAPAQTRQEIVLPSEVALAGAKYCAVIGVSHGGEDFTAIAYSNVANVPSPQVVREVINLPDGIAQFMLPFMNASSSLIKDGPKQEL